MSIPENFEISNSKIPTNVLLPLQPNNKRLEFIRNKQRRKIAFHMEAELWTWMF